MGGAGCPTVCTWCTRGLHGSAAVHVVGSTVPTGPSQGGHNAFCAQECWVAWIAHTADVLWVEGYASDGTSSTSTPSSSSSPSCSQK